MFELIRYACRIGVRRRIEFIAGLVVICVSISSQVRAQTNAVGMYFDEAGTLDRYETTTTPEIVAGWVVLKSPSDPNGIGGVYMRGSTSYGPLNGVSEIGPMYYGEPGLWTFAADPLVSWAESIPVIAFDLLVDSPEQRVELFLGPADGLDAVCYYPVTNPEGGYVALSPVNGDFGQPLAIINENGVVPDQDQAWGQVKALYR